jgi:ricin-type beta-trefoil lectin protein
MSAWTGAGGTILRRISLPAILLTLTASGLSLLAATSPSSFASVRTPAITMQLGPGPILSGRDQRKCVDDLGDSAKDDTPVVLWDCNGSPEQQWTVETDGTIQTNGRCLDVYRQYKTNRTMVELYACNGGSNQQWQVVNGTLVNPVSAKCLDDPNWSTANGTQLQIYTCNGGRNQQWILP